MERSWHHRTSQRQFTCEQTSICDNTSRIFLRALQMTASAQFFNLTLAFLFYFFKVFLFLNIFLFYFILFLGLPFVRVEINNKQEKKRVSGKRRLGERGGRTHSHFLWEDSQRQERRILNLRTTQHSAKQRSVSKANTPLPNQSATNAGPTAAPRSA